MKHVSFLLLLFFIAAVPFGCQKNEYKIESDTTCTPTDVSSRELLSPVPVSDGMLAFTSVEHYNQVRAQVLASQTADLMSWQGSFNFKSAQYYYREAIGQQCCPDSEDANMPTIAANYNGKVLYDAAEQDLKPIIPMVTTGWLVNENGELKVGSSLIHYSNQYVISVVDGSRTKMDAAIANPVNNPSNGVYVHSIVAAAAPCCPWALDAPSVNTGGGSGSKRIKTAYMTNWDESYAVYIPQLNTTIYNVIFTFAIYFHHQRKTWLGWTVCQRTQWQYKASETAQITNIPANCGCLPPGFVNPVLINIPLTTTGNECKYNYEKQIFAALNVSPTAYYSIGLCTNKMKLETKALDSGLSTGASCN